MKKIIFFLIDGLADFADKKTPLRLAKKDFLNSIKNKIHLSYIYPVEYNYWPQQGNYSVSGIANLHLLGYRIKPERFKRGPYEAIGSNIKFKDGWLAFRANFATINNKLRVIDRRAGRNDYGFKTLAKKINRINFEIPFKFYHTSGHRGVLIFEYSLSDKISENDPYKIGRKIKTIKPLAKDNLSYKTALLINRFLTLVYSTLEKDKVNKKRKEKNLIPVNAILLREPGNKILKLKNFFEKYNFKSGVVIATNGVDKGTCLSLGFAKEDLVYPKNIYQEFNNLAKAINKNYPSYQLLYCHLKKADELSHDKNFYGKQMFFETFDLFLKKIYHNFKQSVFVITGDHITNVKDGEHKFGPVPLIIINSSLTNNPSEISELEAIKLGRAFKNNSQLWYFLRKNVN